MNATDKTTNTPKGKGVALRGAALIARIEAKPAHLRAALYDLVYIVAEAVENGEITRETPPRNPLIGDRLRAKGDMIAAEGSDATGHYELAGSFTAT